ncbi:hypothetical protein CCH79_00009944 [Gambusia affinis]|uniref:Uncharacterized protein n=1 Tax=Gambusia affinis TaxID=33528 RepID=A0A315V5T6_GAMAF|nr:hypothetical protein CCH79_00009944 [Gambusia affinis]
MSKLKANYYMEKMKNQDLQKKYEDLQKENEDLKESKTSKEAKVKNDIALETPTSDSKDEMQTNKQVKFLPPIDRKSVRYQTLSLGEGTLVAHFKEDKLITPEKVNQLKPMPPSTRKPEMSLTSAGRKGLDTETEQRNDGGQPDDVVPSASSDCDPRLSPEHFPAECEAMRISTSRP